MLGGDKKKVGPVHLSFSWYACVIGISLSFYPCTMKVGHVTRCIRPRLLNCSAIRKLRKPTLFVATLFIEV